ncbi:MAG: LUD domain-containing protein [Caldilineaceae bacterium]|nr:LUD domain-containing protein [Caldilineaceae bacterium]
MSTTKARMLARIQTALQQQERPDAPSSTASRDYAALPRPYRSHDLSPREEIITRFIERVTEYKAHVQRVTATTLAPAIAAALGARGIQRLVVPADLPAAWLPTELTLLRDAGDLTYETLDSSQGVLTGCALGIAQTGTIVLDHGAQQGRRAISLVPDYHLCIVQVTQIVGFVPEAIQQLDRAVRNGQPLTFISGPSATSDIELNRVEGVHGPRTLEVLVIEDQLEKIS